jgi:hypothetical protein
LQSRLNERVGQQRYCNVDKIERHFVERYFYKFLTRIRFGIRMQQGGGIKETRTITDPAFHYYCFLCFSGTLKKSFERMNLLLVFWDDSWGKNG